MSKNADLHMHTTESDGASDRSTVISVARNRGLDVIALTDHDTYHDFEAPVIESNGVKVISGIELRVEAPEINERVDILAYGVKQTDELNEMVSNIRSNRKVRAQEMIDRIAEETGVVIDLEPEVSTGRPNIARSVAENDSLDYTYEECFEELIGNDNYCYVSRDIPTFQNGVEVLKKSSHYTSLAHPYRYKNPHDAIRLAKNLDAVECYYNYADSVDTDEFAHDFVENHGLGKTGGSDAHRTKDIGKAGITGIDLERFAEDSGLEPYL